MKIVRQHSLLDVVLRQTLEVSMDVLYIRVKFVTIRQQIQVILRHKETFHEGVKIQCNRRDYAATHQSNLKAYKEGAHEVVKYMHIMCNY